MNDWIVETSPFIEDLMSGKMIMLNQKGINEVISIIKEKDKEIERLNNIINEFEKWLESHLDEEYYWFKVYDKLKGLKENNDEKNN